MTQPTPYTRQYNFTDFQTTNPNAPLPGAQVDAELNAVKVTSDQTRVNLGVIQRDDTKLRNQSVHKDAFDLDALAMIGVDGFNPRGNWAATTVYAPQDLVNYNNATYLALIAHTATAVFPTDLAANKWILIANAAIGDVSSAVDYYTGNGSTTAFTLTYSYTSNTGVQVYVNGVLQLPIVGATPGDYSLSGTTLTFVTAPAAPSVAGRKNVVVWGANVTVQANVTAAQTAASNAQGYASAASSSASSAAASAATATTQATNASTSAASAAASATTATAQAVIATTQATTSTNQATTATTQATSATNSAAAAAASQSAAGTSATNAANSASTATTQATNAGTSASAASTSATNAAASASTATTQATTATNAATTATTQAAGATTSATNAATSATTATNQATIATTQATNASTSATNAAASATTATNQATTATTQATNAATSASGASTSATNAAASAATATTQATNSATSASAASSSAVSAATSAASAAALLDNFDDRYLGPKATDPALDNDGNALITGALYFNTTAGVMKVYTASGWLAASSASVATLATFEFVATAAQTVFTGNDANGASLSYVAPALIVTLNGVRLRPGDDYTATNGTSITLVSAAAASDELVVDAFGAFLVASVNGADIQDGTTNISKLNATGTRSASTFLAGNNTFQTVAVTPAAVSDQNNTSTGYFDLPSGTTAQRPASPANGMMRYNTTTSQSEIYQNGGWVTFAVAAPSSVNYLAVAGGGGGGGPSANGGIGGGGAGGLLTGSVSVHASSVYTITVGAGGATQVNGVNTTAFGLTAIGGGRGGIAAGSNGASGGSGGGGGETGGIGGAGTAGQGNAGGSHGGSGDSGAGGGGAGAVGGNAANNLGGNGGNGVANSLSGSSVTYAGGGGGSSYEGNGGTGGNGGSGGGGNGATPARSNIATGGTANTGGGGGGYGTAQSGNGAGGSGIVIISYANTFRAATATGTFTLSDIGGNYIYTFTGSGTITF